MDVLFVVCSNYVSSCYDHYPPCVTCVLQSNAHHYDGYTSSHLCVQEHWVSIMGLCWPQHYMQQQQPQSQIHSQVYANYAMGKFLFQSWAFHQFLMSCWCLMVSAFRLPFGYCVHQGGLNYRGLWHHNTIRWYPNYASWWWSDPCQECTEWLLLPWL